MVVSPQPAREFGIEPVPQGERTLGFWDSFVLWADLGISFLVMVVGMVLVGFVVYALASRRIARGPGVREWAKGPLRQNGR